MQEEIIQTIPPRVYIKGDNINDLIILVYDDMGNPLDLNMTENKLCMFPYGHPEIPVIFSDGNYYKIGGVSSTENNECSFVLSSKDTENLEFNKYTYHIILVPRTGTDKDIKRIEGEMIFKSSISL